MLWADIELAGEYQLIAKILQDLVRILHPKLGEVILADV